MHRLLISLSFILLISLEALSLSIDSLKSNAMKISKILDTSIIIQASGSMDINQKVLIVRFIPEDDEYETVATGKVLSKNGKFATIKLDMDKLKKQPNRTDVVFLLGQPKKFPLLKQGSKEKTTDPELDKIEKFESGYLWFQYLSVNSKIESTSSNQANSFKNINKMPRSGFDFEWFLDFLPSYGIGYSLLKSKIPIKSYYRNSVDGESSQTSLRLMYRLECFHQFRFMFYFQSLLENFTTDNPDEYVISSLQNINSLGTSIYWEPGELLFKSPKSSIQFTFFRVQYLYGLTGTVQDGFAIQRGSTGNLQGQEFKFGASATVYLPWIPGVQRWTLSIDSFQRTSKMIFSGSTKSEGSFYQIPEGGQYTEIDSGLSIGIGVRFDDFIGRVFKPKD